MPTVTSRRASPSPKALKHRRGLAEELIGINRRQATDNARMAAIETELKAIATAQGESFIEDFAGIGKVTASGAVAAEFKGEAPVLQTEIWLAMKPADRVKLEKQGIIKVEKQWGRASSGKVTVKIHEAA